MKNRPPVSPFVSKGLSLIPGVAEARAPVTAIPCGMRMPMGMRMGMSMPGGMMRPWPARRDPVGSRGG